MMDRGKDALEIENSGEEAPHWDWGNHPEIGQPQPGLLTNKPGADMPASSHPTSLILTKSFTIRNRRNKHDIHKSLSSNPTEFNLELKPKKLIKVKLLSHY